MDAPKLDTSIPDAKSPVDMKWLSKRVGGLPVYVWGGGLVGGVVVGLYLRSRHTTPKQTATSEDDSTEPEPVDYSAEPSYPSGSGVGPTELTVPQGSSVVTDPETGGTVITVPGSAVSPGAGAVDTGGGPPDPGPQTPAPAPPSPPPGWTRGSTVAGRHFGGVKAHHIAGKGSNKNGNYTTHEMWYGPGHTEKYNHYTSGKFAGKWVGPF